MFSSEMMMMMVQLHPVRLDNDTNSRLNSGNVLEFLRFATSHTSFRLVHFLTEVISKRLSR